MSSGAEKDEKIVRLRTHLVDSLFDQQIDFWSDVDLDEHDLSEDEAVAINLTGVMDFAALTLAQAEDVVTKEQWLLFCEKIFERAEYEQVEVTTLEVGEA